MFEAFFGAIQPQDEYGECHICNTVTKRYYMQSEDLSKPGHDPDASWPICYLCMLAQFYGGNKYTVIFYYLYWKLLRNPTVRVLHRLGVIK